MTKFYLYKRSVIRIKQVSVCCHGNNFLVVTKFIISSVSLNAAKSHLQDIRSTLLVNDYVIKMPPLYPQNFVLKKKIGNLYKGHLRTGSIITRT